MPDVPSSSSDLNRAGRRAEARKARLRKAGAALATVPAAMGTTALLLGATAGPAGAAPLLVTNLDPAGAGSLHDVAEGAADGDVITFQSGLTGTITLSDTIDIDTSVIVQGPGADVVTVSGNHAVRIFNVAGPGPGDLDVTISGLTLTAGSIGGNGGAIDFDNANLTVRDAVLTDNTATGDGGAIAGEDSALLTIIDSTLSGNSAEDDGGAIYFYAPDADFVMSGTTVDDNTSSSYGGGLWVGAGEAPVGSVEISDSRITGSTAGDYGGGARIYNVEGPVTIGSSVFSGNSAGAGGGGISFDYVLGATAITGTVVSGNHSDEDGGGIYFEHMLGGTTIAFSTFSGNHTPLDGGGIEWIRSDELLIESSTLSGNTAGRGGGMYISGGNYAPVTIVNSTISGNTATGEYQEGEDGGAIFLGSYYGLTVVQSTITQNVAPDVGGIFMRAFNPGSAEANVGTQAQDADPDHGGAPAPAAPVRNRAEGGPVGTTIIGTILIANAGADAGFARDLAATGSIVGTVTGTVFVDQGGNLFDVDPLLGPLADNGGPTQTHELLAGSPAINAGPNPVATFPGHEFDQRGDGYARVVAGVVDVGAFEVQPVQLEPTFTG